MPSRPLRATTLLLFVLGGVTTALGQSFVTFETGQVRPLALSPDGTHLFAINTPDNRLEIFDVAGAAAPSPGALTHSGSVPVGLEPIAVAARTSTEVWVVNHLSDSISIVDVSAAPPRVVRTLLTCDEPRDIVFAGPSGSRAFVTTARRGQNCPVPADETTPGLGRAVVQVFDAPSHGGAGLGGTPLANVVLFGDTPRALAVGPGGGTVYAAVFHSGNQTTALNEGVVCNGGSGAPACTLPDGITMPGGLPGAQVPGGLPAPSPLNCAGQRQPEVGLIVKFNNATNHWEDELGRNWNNAVRFSLPDQDVFAIDANGMTVAGTPWAHVGTVLFNMAVNPASGRVYVSNTEAHNEVRFEGPGTCSTTVRGHLHEARITVLDGANVNPRHLNKHLNYSVVPSPMGDKVDSLAIPVGMALNGAGTTLYLAAFGSDAIGRFSTAQLEADTFVPDSTTHIGVTGGGPSGLVLNEGASRLYVLTRFDNAVSVINTATNAEIDHLPLFNPEPPEVIDGRPVLYDAQLTSSNGEASCASCHVFGDFDSLAWDLGNPSDSTLNDPNPFRLQIVPICIGGTSPGQLCSQDTDCGFGGTCVTKDFRPMKGPMTTQTLRGMANNGPMHWRGDRTGGNDPGGNALAEDQAFKKFIIAFDGLLGRGAPITDADMDRFTNFILEVALPPNPNRPLDNQLVGAAAAGRTQYLDVNDRTDVAFHCAGCHVLNAAQGAFGTDGRMSFEGETQEFKIPHLRNIYQKVGMFGMPQSPFIKPGGGPVTDQGPQIRGFGFLHDGSIDTTARFHNANVFNLTATEAQNMEQFMLQFDSNLAPIVGQQVTLGSANGADANPRIDLLLARAASGECDVTVKGTLGGEQRGWYRLPDGTFRSDRSSEPVLTDGQLRTQAGAAGQERTYTCVPVGSGERIGVDRDMDGCFDRDELDLGTDPTSAASNACFVSTVCGPAPANGCRAATPGKSSIALRAMSDPTKDSLRWRWKGGNTVTADFKDPVHGAAAYHVCIYDASADAQPLLEGSIPPGGTCNGRPCWKPSTTHGFRYKSKGGLPSGFTQAVFKEGQSGKASVSTTARGADIPMPPLSLTLPVTVQLVIDDGGTPQCWQTIYSSAVRNDAGQFRAKGP